MLMEQISSVSGSESVDTERRPGWRVSTEPLDFPFAASFRLSQSASSQRQTANESP